MSISTTNFSLTFNGATYSNLYLALEILAMSKSSQIDLFCALEWASSSTSSTHDYLVLFDVPIWWALGGVCNSFQMICASDCCFHNAFYLPSVVPFVVASVGSPISIPTVNASSSWLKSALLFFELIVHCVPPTSILDSANCCPKSTFCSFH